MLVALLDSYLDFLPKCVLHLEGKEYTALYLHFDHLHENQLMSDFSHSVAPLADDPEQDHSGDHCFLVVPKAEDGIQL